MKRRILSIFIIFCMCMTILPQGAVTVSAAEGSFSGGTGEEGNPYLISSVEDLEALADAVNDGNSYAGQYFKLTQDIDLSEKYNKDKNKSWVPIGGGQKKPFSGTFDGGKENGYQITGLYMYVDDDLVSEYGSQLHGFTYPCFGLFGYVQDGVIQNLSVDGDISAEEVAGKDELGNHVGGIVGYNKGTIKECEYDGTITTRSEVESIGGIVGYNGEGSTIEHCTNDGDIEITEADSRTPSRRIGGIVGTNNGTVRECGHTGSITSEIEEASYKIQLREIGGIVGGIVDESTIEHCTNDGDIKITKITADYGIDVSGIGGIVGGVSSEVKDCHNTGNITVEFEGEGEIANVGGISGTIGDWGDDFIKVTGCTNTGEIKADKGKYVGGISASIGMEDILGTMTDCRNEGTVQGSSQVGGIAGYARNTTIKRCYNHGEVTADGDNRSEAAGGILGWAKKDDDGTPNTAVESCYNWGNVKGPNYVGGIVGEHNGNKIENCYNVGSVTGENVGGIGVGDLNSDSENYYLDTCLEEPEEAKGDGQTPKNEIQFQFGEVAFLLQNGQTELDGSDKSFWGQQLTGDEVDEYPIFTEDDNKRVEDFGLTYTDPEGNGQEAYANPDSDAPLPDGSTLQVPGSEVKMKAGGENRNRTTFNREGAVTLPGGGSVKIGGSTVTAPDSKVTIEPRGEETVTLPEDVTVELENDDMELGLPDGGVMDKDGNVTLEKDGRFVLGGTIVTVPEEVTIEPDEEGNIELLPDTRAKLSSGEEMNLPKGGVIDRDGNVTPYGGALETKTESEDGAPEITVPKGELEGILSDEDRKAMEEGKDIKIRLVVKNIEEEKVSAEDAEKIKKGASYYDIGQYLDIKLLKTISVNGDSAEEPIQITNTDQEICIVITIPEELRKAGRSYAVVRLHEGETTLLDDRDDEPDTLTIATDRFSTYVLVYTDLTDEDRVAGAKEKLPEILDGLTVTNDTTRESLEKQMQEAMNEAGFSDVKVTVGEDFGKDLATTGKEGRVTATVTVSKGDASADTDFDKNIAKLEPTPSTPSGPTPSTTPSTEPSTTPSAEPSTEPSATPPTVTLSPREQEKNSIAMMAGFKVSQTSEKISIKWGKVKGAGGYQVYVTYCGKDFTGKPIKTVKSASITKVKVTKINGKKLNLKKNYKVYITAYKIVNGKKGIVGKTLVGHIVGKKNHAYTNVKQVKVSKSKYTLQAGKTAKIRAKTVLVDKTKKQLSDAHAKELRYQSTDTHVAVVSKKGKITAKGKGTCIIYVYARNGYAKKIKVTVK